MTYYKVKTAKEIIPNYADYIKRQITDAYIAGPMPKETGIIVRVHQATPPEGKGNNAKFIDEKFQRISRGKIILDCACGGGAEIDQLKRMGFQYVVGIELNDKFIKTAKTVADGVVKADMHWLPFRDICFDIIFSAHTIEHAYDVTQLLQEFYRILKLEDGKLFVILPYPDGGDETDFHCAKYELGTNILDHGKSVIKFFEENGFYVDIREDSHGTVGEPLLWLQLRNWRSGVEFI